MQATAGQWASGPRAYMPSQQGGWSSTTKSTIAETLAETAKRKQKAALEEMTRSEWFSITPGAFGKRRKGALTRTNIR